MAQELVLLTGGTGFLGFAILMELLRSGYRVRVVARSQSKVDGIRTAPSISALDLPATHLTFVIVPDMTAIGAYDDAVHGVDVIIHVAAPVSAGEEGSAIVATSVNGSLGILKSALEKGSAVRRIVMTSSTVAIAPSDIFAAETKEREVVRGPESRVTVPSPPYDSYLQAYCASKAAALNASEAFMRDNTASFDLISIMPSLIFGKDELVTDTKGLRTGSTTMLIDGLLTGKHGEAGIANVVLCSDVARAHVKALDPSIEGNQSFLLNTQGRWEDTVPIAKKHFPDAFKSGLFREGDPRPTLPIAWDSSKVCRRNCIDA
jgi:nucleoside-diphosphate-sugar epimerase